MTETPPIKSVDQQFSNPYETKPNEQNQNGPIKQNNIASSRRDFNDP